MSALSAAQTPTRFRDGPHLEAVPTEPTGDGHLSNRKMDDPASRRFLREIGERVASRRQELGMKPEELALRIGVGAARLRQIETGSASLNKITALAEALDVDAYWLLHGVTEDQAGLGALVAQLRQQAQDLEAMLGDSQ